MTGQKAGPHVLVVHPGGLGDLVLVSELVASLKQAHPERSLTLLCRSEFTALVGGYPVLPDEVVGLPFQPYALAEPSAEPSAELPAFLQPTLERFAGRRWEAMVDAALRPNWLSEFLASALKPEIAIHCGLGRGGPGPLPALLEQFGLSRQAFRNLELPPGTYERDRYRLLADALESPFIPTFPWSLRESWRQPALDWLRQHGLERGRYLVCAPFGAASTPVKRWPMESFNEVLHRFFRDSRWPVLLMGDHTEHESLAGLESLLFDIPTSHFSGRPEELPLAAGILAMAGAYLSNDTGLMHLAQAFELPGTSIFGGGGEWPAYAPWARGSVGLCHPLPCFGCGWDCFLGHGLCVESIAVDKVYDALAAVCRAPAEAPHNVILETLGEPLLGLVADASARYRESQRDRSERLEVIVELDRSRHAWAARERELLNRVTEAEAATAAMERVAAERLTVLEDVHTEAARRLDLIHEISGQAEAGRRSVEQLTAALARSEAGRQQLEQALGPEPPRPSEGSHWIATGADSEYFANARLLIASWWEHNSSLPLLFCDFGLTAEQREEASAWPVHLAPARGTLADVPPRRAKAGLIHYLNSAGVQWKSVTWIDADAVLLRPLPRLDEIACGYDLLCDASPLPVAEAIDPANRALLPLDPADVCFAAGFWTATSHRLLEAFDRFADVLLPRGQFHEGDALTAAIYATRARVRTLCGHIWHIRGATSLDRVAVDGDWLGYAGERAYVLHANRRFVVLEDGQRVLNRDVLRAIQVRLGELYRADLIGWRKTARLAAL